MSYAPTRDVSARRGWARPWISLFRILSVTAILLLALSPLAVAETGTLHDSHPVLSDSIGDDGDHHHGPGDDGQSGCCHAIAICAAVIAPASGLLIHTIEVAAAVYEQTAPTYRGRQSLPDLQPPTI